MGAGPRTRRLRPATVVPNGLSLARIVLGVVFYWLSPAWRVGAVFAAALSDALDGASSRWLRAASHTGRMLDPIADKAFVLGVVGTLLCEEMLGWREVILLSLRDLVETGNTLKANGLVEVERIMDISSRLVVNQAALKLKQAPIRAIIDEGGTIVRTTSRPRATSDRTVPTPSQ